jgi:two-component system chemotaxis response regulator CheY
MAKNVLIVDDSGVLRKLIARSIRQCFNVGEIWEAGDGQLGLAELEKHPNTDLILLDWNMPNMDGITFLKAIRGKGIKTPVIMVTTEASDTKVAEAKASGANGYVCKPFTPEAMESTLGKYL